MLHTHAPPAPPFPEAALHVSLLRLSPPRALFSPSEVVPFSPLPLAGGVFLPPDADEEGVCIVNFVLGGEGRQWGHPTIL